MRGARAASRRPAKQRTIMQTRSIRASLVPPTPPDHLFAASSTAGRTDSSEHDTMRRVRRNVARVRLLRSTTGPSPSLPRCFSAPFPPFPRCSSAAPLVRALCVCVVCACRQSMPTAMPSWRRRRRRLARTIKRRAPLSSQAHLHATGAQRHPATCVGTIVALENDTKKDIPFNQRHRLNLARDRDRSC